MTRAEAKLVLDSLTTWEGEERMITAEIVEAIRVLPQEPHLSNNLEEAAEISFDEAYALTEDYRDFLARGLIENKPRPISPHWFCEYAKKRFIAGAEWQKQQDLAEMAQSKSPLSVAYANRCFENGKQAMKEQMLKDAVEGEVYLYHSYNRDATAILVDIPKENLGDKVSIVVLKVEEE